MVKIDLHSHTTASDGRTSPTESVQLAARKGLAALAITDHDSVSGIGEALEAAQGLDLEIIPGIEVSTGLNGMDIHVLGYFLDYEDEQLQQDLALLRETRNKRNELMIARLNELGIDITYEEVAAKQKTKEGNIGRPHIAEVLIDKQVVSSMEEAFREYLGKHGKAYIHPPRISPEEGVELILRYGGIPVLAHPGLYDLDHIIPSLVEVGLKGIEVFHPDHTDRDKEKYLRMAERYGLIVTGGSDYHGERNGVIFHADLGSQAVPPEALMKLKELKRKG